MAAGEKIRDTEFMARAFGELLEQKQEFPIRVEGARTLPYSALVHESDAGRHMMILKLFRPLPPALAMGARFDLVFAFQGKRYEGKILLQEREGYLRYRFEWPSSLLSTDRRLWKRYMFRPRENVFVTAQDTENPCHGLLGPITNLSQGGFCFRVDRLLRLEDGLPVRPRANLFLPGKALSLIRIHGLIKDEDVEARGVVVRVQEGDSEIHLAVQFSGLGEEESAMLSRILAARDSHASRGRGAGPSSSPKPRGPGGPASSGELGSADVEPTEEEMVEGELEEGAPDAMGMAEADSADGEDGGEPGEAGADPDAEEAPPATDLNRVPELAGLGALLRLDRRSVRLLLVAAAEPDQADILARLQTEGFWRVEPVATLEAALAAFQTAEDAPFQLLMVDLDAGARAGRAPAEAAAELGPRLQAFGDLPVAFCTKAPDPQLELLAGSGLGAVALEDPDPSRCAMVLDWLLGLKRMDGAATG